MMRQGAGPIMVLRQNTKREKGSKAQLANIQAGQAIAEVVRSTLGPQAMLKMLLDPMGGIVMTNDGNAILRECDVSHPAAKTLIDLSRTQDDNAGDGTTSVVVLAGELLSVAEPLLCKKMHPTLIVSGYIAALTDALQMLNDMAIEVDMSDDKFPIEIINSCLSTKFSSRWGDLIATLALKAVKVVSTKLPGDEMDIDIKRYAKVEKIPGGDISDCCVMDGVLLNKDVTHAKMRRCITNPKILLLDCPLEYKKGESQTAVEIVKEEDWAELLQQEENEIKQMCDDIIATGCNVVITEKGVSDLAQHFLVGSGVTAIRRVRKTDNNRIARISGAQICARTDELNSSDVGTKCGLCEIKKIGDEYYTYLTGCQGAKACTVLLRGGSKDVLNEIERNLQDAMHVARNIVKDSKILPGGGATEVELSARLVKNSNSIEGSKQWAYRAVASALEVIPRTLMQNCGCNVIRTLTELKAKHAVTGTMSNWGVNGMTGEISDMTKLGVYDTFTVKQQILKTAIEASAMLLRIDDVLSGIKTAEVGAPTKAAPGGALEDEPDSFGDSRDG